MKDRVRKVNVSKMTKDQLKEVETNLAAKVNEIVQKAIDDANKYLSVYSMNAKMIIEINEIAKETKKTKQPKSDNLLG